jgi:hypothetical protein
MSSTGWRHAVRSSALELPPFDRPRSAGHRHKFPADDVKTFERLIDEIERVPTISIGAVRFGGKDEV